MTQLYPLRIDHIVKEINNRDAQSFSKLSIIFNILFKKRWSSPKQHYLTLQHYFRMSYGNRGTKISVEPEF